MDNGVAARATRREWIGLAVIALPCMLYSMDLTVLNLAVPQLSADLKPSAARAPLDRRYLRLSGRRLVDPDGNARRPDRPAKAAADRRRRVRARVRARRLLHQRRYADRDPRASRCRGSDARALDLVAAPQHVPRSRPAELCDRGMDHKLLGRRSDRTADRRSAASVFLVGLGVPARRAGHAPPPGARSAAPARIPRPECRQARFCQRGAVARLRALGDLWPEADRTGWIWLDRRARHPGRPRDRRRLRSPPAQARRSDDRSQALPAARLQRIARRLPARDICRLRHVRLRGAIPAAGAWAGAARGRPLDRALRDRLHCRLADHADLRTADFPRRPSSPAAFSLPRSGSRSSPSPAAAPGSQSSSRQRPSSRSASRRSSRLPPT